MALSRTPWPIGLQRRQTEGLGRFELLTAPGISYDPGALVICPAGSVLAQIPNPAAPSPAARLMGTFVGTTLFTSGSSTDPATGGAIDPNTGQTQKITVQPLSSEGTADFATGTGANQITAANIDDPAYIYDNDTFYPTDLGGTLPWGGFVGDVDPNGRVTIKHSSSLRSFWEMYSAGQATLGATSDGSASYCMTNLPAGSFSGGVWTATATGAISTTQDGLTVSPVVGDIVIFPPGVLGSLTVTGPQSGPYECVVPGATGVKAVYQRPAKFAHGATITPGTKWKVTLGGATTFSGTTWRCDPTTAAKVVDTDDPVMFPERVVVQKTCASGTATIATVPLRAAGLFSVTCDFNGGTPAATTTSIQASTQTPGALGTASIVIQEQSVLGTLVNTGTAHAAVLITQ
jgi:hypothetical protein